MCFATIGSSQGNVTFTAGGNLAVIGSDLIAGRAKDATTGGNITLQARPSPSPRRRRPTTKRTCNITANMGCRLQFFDRVNHDILMSRVARHVHDTRVLKLIRRYLEAGLMRDGITTARNEGTPQGGPLSPLLLNILLTDRELEKRGHAFCRYADDCNIYVHSHAAGQRVLVGMKAFLEKRLKLPVNEAKSVPWGLIDGGTEH